MTNPEKLFSDVYPPAQGQAINLAGQTFSTAEQHMQNMGEMLVGPDFRAGYSTMVDIRHPERNEDSVLMAQLQDGSSVMSLFDGAGHYGAGDKAAQAARQELYEQLRSGNLDSVDRGLALTSVFKSMSERVSKDVVGNLTTATVVIIGPAEIDGSRVVDWAAVGDSPMFYRDPETNQVIEITHEESQRQLILDAYAVELKNGETEESYEDAVKRADSKGSVILNALGKDTFRGLSQIGRFRLPKGAQLLLASDGITGDKSTQRLDGGESNERVIGEVLGKSLNVKQKALELVKRATKIDDRTALIFENTAIEQQPLKLAPENPASPADIKARDEDARLLEAERQNIMLVDQVNRENAARKALLAAQPNANYSSPSTPDKVNQHSVDLPTRSSEAEHAPPQNKKNAGRIATALKNLRDKASEARANEVVSRRTDELAGFVPNVVKLQSSGRKLNELVSDGDAMHYEITNREGRLNNPLVESGGLSLTQLMIVGNTVIGVVDNRTANSTEVLLLPFGGSAGLNKSSVKIQPSPSITSPGLDSYQIFRKSLENIAGDSGGEDPGISRTHLELLLTGSDGGTMLPISKSTNGTFLIDGTTPKNQHLQDLLDHIKLVNPGVLYSSMKPAQKMVVPTTK